MMRSIRMLGMLLWRDQKDVWHSARDSVINSSILFFFQAIQFLYLYPLLGMPPEMAASVYIGTFIFVIIEVAFTSSMNMVYDLRFNRFVEYYMSLPLGRNWVLSFYVLSTMLRMLINTIPMFLLAKILLGAQLPLAGVHWLGLVVIYLLSMLFCTLLFFTVAFMASFDWYLNSLWQQLLMPLQMLGGVFFTFASVEHLFPRLVWVMRCNPFTYMIEGLRMSMLGYYHTSISITHCLLVMVFVCVMGCVTLSLSAKRRLDTV